MTDNKAALEAEAVGVTLREVTYRDLVFKVEGEVEEWDVDVMEAYENGKSIGVIRGLLGEKQWAQFKATKPKNKDFAELTEAVFAVIGVTEGESAD